MRRHLPVSSLSNTLFPYTTLFRSDAATSREGARLVSAARDDPRDEWPRQGSDRHRQGDDAARDGAEYHALSAPDGPAQSRAAGRGCTFRSLPQRPARPETRARAGGGRSEEHTSELQSLMRISYAVFCLEKQKTFSGYIRIRVARSYKKDA